MPASTDGASLSALMVTVTVSLCEYVPSDTVSWNTTGVFTTRFGAVKVGDAAVPLLSVIVGPLTCVHAYLSGAPSGSTLPVPVSVATPPSVTPKSIPAEATGAKFFASIVPSEKTRLSMLL